METYNIYEAEAHFSRILPSVEEGRAVLIAREGVVVARIIPEPRAARIRLGRDVGRAVIGPDFDAPLTDFDEYTGE